MDNLQMDLGETRGGAMNWNGLAQDRNQRKDLNAVINLRVP
jgi:hypothetical protein